MTEQGDESSQPARLAYESPKAPVGRHGRLVYLRDDAGGLTVTGPHSDPLEWWPWLKRAFAILLGVGVFMMVIGAAYEGLTIDLTRGTLGLRGNPLARVGVYVTVVPCMMIGLAHLLLRRRRIRVTIEANREGVTYRVQPHGGPERVESWTADEIAGVGASIDGGPVLALRDGRHVRLYLGRHYAEWMQLADDVNRSLGRPLAELAPRENKR